MRRPHVYERSAPRPARDLHQRPSVEAAETARRIADAVNALIPHAESAGLLDLVETLMAARRAAESAATRPR